MKAIGTVQESRASMWITMFARFGSGTFSAGKWTSLRPYGGSIKALVNRPAECKHVLCGDTRQRCSNVRTPAKAATP